MLYSLFLFVSVQRYVLVSKIIQDEKKITEYLKKNNKLRRFQKSSNILKMRSYNFFFKSVDVQMTKYTYLQYTDFVYMY